MTDILIGTSGFDYPEWKGVFYPADLKRQEFLEYYATQFNGLEINNTFYRMPDSMRLRNFYERTEGRLQFSIKANRGLTHEIEKEWKKTAETFRFNILPLLQKEALSAVLFQFPQSFHYTPENRFYLADLIKEFDGYPVCVEFRHKGWIKESVFEGLEKRKASIVFCDMPMCHLAQMSILSNYANGAERRMPKFKYLPDGTACRTPFIGPSAYLRMHGRNSGAWYDSGDTPNGSGRYDYFYSEEELESFVPVIQAAQGEGKKVQAFFNNHPRGSGAKNAAQLKDILDKIIKIKS